MTATSTRRSVLRQRTHAATPAAGATDAVLQAVRDATTDQFNKAAQIEADAIEP